MLLLVLKSSKLKVQNGGKEALQEQFRLKKKPKPINRIN